MRAEHFVKMNGYANTYWGWGGEDEDAFQRASLVGLTPFSAPAEIARYINTSLFSEITVEQNLLLQKIYLKYIEKGLCKHCRNKDVYAPMKQNASSFFILLRIDIMKDVLHVFTNRIVHLGNTAS